MKIVDELPVRARPGSLLQTLRAGRFRFGWQHLHVRTWRGWRSFAWEDVRSARLVAAGGGVVLALGFGPRVIVRVPLLAWHGSARLLADIERRLPVATSAPPSLKARLERAD